MKTLVWLDLCSGLGGASQPALDRGWKVIRVDIDPRFKPDIVADVRHLPLKPFHVDVLWASPPCQEFSKWGMRCFFPNPPEPDLSIALGVHKFIQEIGPAFWAVENVWSARPWLSKIFGPVRALIPGHAIWSDLGFLLPNIAGHKGGLTFDDVKNGKRRRTAWANHSNKRSFIPHVRDVAIEAAKIPYEIGEAICAAVERRAEEARA